MTAKPLTLESQMRVATIYSKIPFIRKSHEECSEVGSVLVVYKAFVPVVYWALYPY